MRTECSPGRRLVGVVRFDLDCGYIPLSEYPGESLSEYPGEFSDTAVRLENAVRLGRLGDGPRERLRRDRLRRLGRLGDGPRERLRLMGSSESMDAEESDVDVRLSGTPLNGFLWSRAVASELQVGLLALAPPALLERLLDLADSRAVFAPDCAQSELSLSATVAREEKRESWGMGKLGSLLVDRRKGNRLLGCGVATRCGVDGFSFIGIAEAKST